MPPSSVATMLSVVISVISILTSVITLTTVMVTMKNNVDSLKTHSAKQDAMEEKAAKELTELLILLKTFIGEQSQINKTVEIALTGVCSQLRDMEKRTVESSTTISLLTEVLKRDRKTSIE